MCSSSKTNLNVDLRRNTSTRIGNVDFRKFATKASLTSTTDALLRKLSRTLLISLHTVHICPLSSPVPWNRLDNSSLTMLSSFFRTLISSSSMMLLAMSYKSNRRSLKTLLICMLRHLRVPRSYLIACIATTMQCEQ